MTRAYDLTERGLLMEGSRVHPTLGRAFFWAGLFCWGYLGAGLLVFGAGLLGLFYGPASGSFWGGFISDMPRH